jgi:hypothetical protein
MFAGRVNHSVSNRPIWLAEAANPCNHSVADHPAHCRVAAQPIGVVNILVAGQPTEYRLPQQSGQPMATIFAGARVGERIGTRLGQPDRIIQLAIG